MWSPHNQEKQKMNTDISDLVEESLSHRAVNHPYLKALNDGDLPCIKFALKDFATHYYGYSLYFPRYLTSVISKLDDHNHRKGLLQNLTEESGVYDQEELDELKSIGIEPEWIQNIPHPILFKRFYNAIGASANDEAGCGEAVQLISWREMFLSTLNHGSAAESVGAIGLGTENIVSTIYLPFVKALSYLNLNPRDTVFFPLHTAVDDHHQETLADISRHYAGLPNGKSDLRKGMIKALSLRSAFWDWMYERATSFKPDTKNEKLELAFA
jgi:pyrroloquinoline quinone (PQQ) biosynthesis protein C